MSGSATKLTVDAILMPDTPEEVRNRYASLAERASQTTFGLLEEDIVMLDTETTGLSFKKCELIEIAAARISGREVVERFRTFVHPSGPIPAEIQALTGIRDVDVVDAPSAVEAVAALADFVGGEPIVAHNASFDRTFIESVRGGHDVSDTWIDSLSLSRIALPRLRTHRLADMAQAFGCAGVTHRAMDDVDALCGMWRILLLALSDLPAGLLDRLASAHEDVSWSFRPILANVARGQYGSSFSMKAVRSELMSRLDSHRHQDALEQETDVFGLPTADDVAQAFGPDGTVSRMYERYECRPEQLSMAQEVRAAQTTSTMRALEAGTGVGKSVAYLLPSVLFAREHDVTVGIATKTNALTDQLVSHELPALDAALPGGVTFSSIKGYDHYPCLHRVDLALVRELPVERVEADGRTKSAIASDMLTAIAVTSAFACQSSEGDLDALGIRWRYVPRDLLTVTPAECLRMRCPYYPNECFVHGARRRAACSDVVVTNHSLLLRDIDLDNAILPPIRHWVVDEAHSFEQDARRQWAHEFSAEASRAAFGALGGVKSGVIQSLLSKSAQLDGSVMVAGLLSKAASLIQAASIANADLLLAIHDLVPLATSGGGYDSTTLWIDEKIRQSEEWAAVERAAAKDDHALDQAVKALQEAHDAIAPQNAQMASEVSDATRSLKDLLDALRLIVLTPDDRYVYSAELYRAKRRIGRERLVAEKLDVGADLAERWYPNTMSVVYTSATMAVGESFEHFEHAVGLDLLPKTRHGNLRLDSSFDYAGHMSVVVARDMPQPNDRGYLQALEELLLDVHTAMDGSVLTLFTNRREMEQVFQNLRPRLAEAGLELACQERGSSPRRLREEFLAKKHLSLFALKSFWEGFDAAGDTLRCVVIPKLPFASPHDPLGRERDLREPRAWWRYSLPEAVLGVKQAAGRLIRSESDTGVLVLADSRLVSKRYGQTFLRALPTGNVELERASIGRYIGMWRRSHER